MFGSSRLKVGEITAGQLFRATDGGKWRYVGNAPTKGPEPHVHLVRPDDQRTIKIVSMSALTDRRLFEPIE